MKKILVLALAAFVPFALAACKKSTTEDHTSKSDQHSHASHDHAKHDHAGHDHAKHDHAGHDHAKQDQQPSALQKVEVGCAMCIYKMEGVKKCKLAVKVGGTPYLVEGSTIFNHGDAHAADGLCKTHRQAEAIGEIKEGKYVASTLKLLPKK